MIQAEKNNRKFVFFAFLIFLPYLLFGFQYYPVLDDYIQYGCYPAYGDLSYVYLTIGTISSRPIASFLDPLFWGMLWKIPSLALLFITTLHFFSGFLFNYVAEKEHIKLSPFFFLIYYLFPLGMEARFWLSAASRIIVGLFFSSLSLFILSIYLRQRKKSLLFFFWFIQLLSCGFYEPVAVFSVVSSVFLWVNHRRKQTVFVPVLSLINLSFVFIYYKLFSNIGALGSRVTDAGISNFIEKIIEFFKQLFDIFKNSFSITFIGSLQGIKDLFSVGVWGILILVLVLVLSFLLCLTLRKSYKQEKKKTFWLILAGIILFFAPLGPNVLAEPVWLTYRSVFVSFLGMALLLEPLFSILNIKWGRVLLFSLSFIFLTASIHEYTLYCKVSILDQKLVKQVSSELEEASLKGEKRVQVVLSEFPRIEEREFYKDHVKSVFEADWSLSGALREETGNLKIVCATPVLEGEAFNQENCQVIYLNIK